MNTTASVMSELLLIKNINIDILIKEYHSFFIELLPTIFMLAVIVEYLDRVQPIALLKRTFVSILVLTSVGSAYFSGIDYSMKKADESLNSVSQNNILLMDMFSGMKEIAKKNISARANSFKKLEFNTGNIANFIKFHLFDRFINDGFMVGVFFIAKLCFLILKGVFSLAYYLGYGLIGIPCLVYLFPSMGNVLRGGALTYLWCLTIPHVLVFILNLLGSEIERGYEAGQVIGGTLEGTALLAFMALFIAFSPLISMMILNGSGVGQAVGVVATVGANAIMNLPANTINMAASALNGGMLGPKMALANKAAQKTYKAARLGSNKLKQGLSGVNNQFSSPNSLTTKMSKSNSTVGPSSSKTQASNSSQQSSQIKQTRGSNGQVSKPAHAHQGNKIASNENHVVRNRGTHSPARNRRVADPLQTRKTPIKSARRVSRGNERHLSRRGR